MQNQTLLFGTSCDQPSLLKRLREEVSEALRDFSADPRTFIAAAFSSRPGDKRRKDQIRLGMAVALVIYATGLAAMLLLWGMSSQEPRNANWLRDRLIMWFPPGLDAQMPPDKDDSGGGGGGRDKTHAPPLEGQYPDPSLAPQLIAPTPEPQRDEATLPVPETVLVDPRVQFNRDELTPTGVPEGVIGPPVAGPGSDGGAGWGNGGGIGPGNGRGVGPGNDWNLGGKWPAIGGDPRDLEGNTPVRVDSKPVPLNWPRPNYTEEARQHKIEGVVRARVLVGSDGSVQSVVVTAGLPYGLSEEAIRAIKQMRFRPAMKAGRAVTFWISFEVEFNLR